ncbi:hypothetical protein [Actinopolyspora saharensis]|uniref:Uncharacterized protein n=1 Tax=Actinopolyspora saharensis TaxID=995062 RepID=A0A1H0ZUL7_9ACTN|nr:hypothetical protein [Actinopolyspora saharensis]SDQ30931.1 hypothetical protein SAMN04489718_1241 [Actinopolyspora saharensis]
MRITSVDERDSSWERHQPRFRVYFFAGGDAPPASWSTDTYDVTGADVLEVVQWAQEHAGSEWLYAVALVDEEHTPPAGRCRGLTWLVGTDANASREDADEQRRFAAMLDRRGKRVVDLG